MDEEVLRSVFGRFGSITSTVVMRNSSNKSRGFGFVNFDKPDHAASAVEGMNGYRYVPSSYTPNLLALTSLHLPSFHDMMLAKGRAFVDFSLVPFD